MWGGGCDACPWPTPPAQPRTVETSSGDPALCMGILSKTPHRSPGSKQGHGVTRSQPRQQPAPRGSEPRRLSHESPFLHPGPGNHPPEMPPKLPMGSLEPQNTLLGKDASKITSALSCLGLACQGFPSVKVKCAQVSLGSRSIDGLPPKCHRSPDPPRPLCSRRPPPPPPIRGLSTP